MVIGSSFMVLGLKVQKHIFHGKPSMGGNFLDAL